MPPTCRTGAFALPHVLHFTSHPVPSPLPSAPVSPSLLAFHRPLCTSTSTSTSTTRPTFERLQPSPTNRCQPTTCTRPTRQTHIVQRYQKCATNIVFHPYPTLPYSQLLSSFFCHALQPMPPLSRSHYVLTTPLPTRPYNLPPP